MSYIVLVNIHGYSTRTSLMEQILFHSVFCCQQKCFKLYRFQLFKPKITECVTVAAESRELGGTSTPRLFFCNKAEYVLSCSDPFETKGLNSLSPR